MTKPANPCQGNHIHVDGLELAQAVGFRTDKLMYNEEIRQQFLSIDVKRLRFFYLTTSVPPPLPYSDDMVPTIQEDLTNVQDVVDGNSKYVCPDKTSTGQICGEQFTSLRSLQQHRRHSRLGGEHGQVSVTSFVLRPECCYCRSRFASISSACQHVRNSSSRGYCMIDRAYLPSSLEQCEDCVCAVCDEEFLSIEDFYLHILQHLKPPGLKCSQCKAVFPTRDLLAAHDCSNGNGNDGDREKGPLRHHGGNVRSTELGRQSSRHRQGQ